MRPSPFSLPTILKYTLLQLPGLGFLVIVLLWLEHSYALPRWIFWAILLSWLGKDVLLYSLVWRSYAPYQTEERLIGAYGIAREDLAPNGYIEVQGELWRAELVPGGRSVSKGQRVRVVKRRGLTLVVTPDSEEGAASDSESPL
jgi:membrane protein implicated in regulation of membrane protease activity